MRCIDDLKIGVRLGQLRINKKVKKVDVAVEFEISTAQYSRLEHGQSRISVEVLQKACEYYNMTVDYILFGEDVVSESVFFQRLQNCSEGSLRRMLKILSCMLNVENALEYENDPVYKIFMGGLLEKVPIDADTAIPYVLEYEKNIRKVSENTIIRELGLTRFKWNSIMREEKIRDIQIPLAISEQYGYDLNFLINNKIACNMFFDELVSKESLDKQKKILQVFDSVVKMQ